MKKYIWAELDFTQRQEALQRPKVQKNASVEKTVSDLLAEVEREGDVAVRRITKRLDGYDPDPLCVPQDEINAAEGLLLDELRMALEVAYDNLRLFHDRQGYRPYEIKTGTGLRCARKVVPIERVGVYVPAGTAPLISTALMVCVPAQIARCREIILCTPASKEGRVDPAILFVAKLCGVSKVVRIGGVPAIASMAYGTQSLPAVDKIFGPGNMYVAEAKNQVSRKSGGPATDLPAGPSEALVIVDETTPPAFAAADLLAQAEHDKVAQVVLVALQESQIEAIERDVAAQMDVLPRKEIASAAMANSLAFVVETKEQAFEISNMYAPEHLLLSFEDAEAYLDLVSNAGSVFCGVLTPESFGDYASGTNHVLPTGGAARSCSGLTVEAFQKTITVQNATKEGLDTLAPTVIALARAEGLEAHANAVKVRASNS